MIKKLLDFEDAADEKIEYKAAIKVEEVSRKDIAIIGISARLPMADSTDEFWQNLMEGKNCIRGIPAQRKADMDQYFHFKYGLAGEVNYLKAGYLDEIDKFDYKFFGYSPKEASVMDPHQRIFLETAWNALEDAGYGGERLAGSRTGVFVGVGSEMSYMRIVGEVDNPSVSMAIPGNLAPIIASRIAYILDLKGPSFVLDTACSSSLVAVHYACQSVRNGECGMAIAGGVRINMVPVGGRMDIGIESNADQLKAFDEHSDGTLWGEGTVAIVLKPLHKAVEDNDQIYAVIKGSAVNQDGNSIGITAPNPIAQEDVILRAWSNSGVDPKSISYIEAHGTGTNLGDPIEIDGISKAFRRHTDRKQFCAIGSVKTNIGHTDYTAGIAGLLKAVLMLKHGEIPAHLHFSVPNSKIEFEKSPIYVNNKNSKVDRSNGPVRCGINSFGLSGTNCHLILEEAPPKKESPQTAMGPQILMISAKSMEALKVLVASYIAMAEKQQDLVLADICYTATTGRGHYSHRAAFVFDGSVEDYKEKLARLAAKLEGEDKQGVYFGAHRVVAEAKKKANDEEITSDELERFSEAAGRVLKKLIPGREKNADVLGELCGLYVRGAAAEWESIYQGEVRYKTSVPAYPFERKRCWLDIPEASQASYQPSADTLFYKNIWRECRSAPQMEDAPKGGLLILMDDTGKGGEIAERFRSKGREVIEAFHGDQFKEIAPGRYSINHHQESYNELIRIALENGISKIVHMLSITGTIGDDSIKQLEESRERGLFSLLRLTKALCRQDIKDSVKVVIVAEYAEEVTGYEKDANPSSAAMFGLGKVINIENPRILCRCIDVDSEIDAGTIAVELEYMQDEYKIAYRKARRYHEVIGKTEIGAENTTGGEVKDGGTYLITGGTGRIGLEISRHMSLQKKVNLVLVSRSGMPEREKWDDILKEESNQRECRAIKAIREIEKSGSGVSTYACDVSIETEVTQVLEDVKAKFGRIDGIIHAAGFGVGEAGEILRNESEERARKVADPKVKGAWLLYSLTKEMDLDFLSLFSSTITLAGEVGGGMYTAANTYLDAFSFNRLKNGRKVNVINWPLWKGTLSDESASEGTYLFRAIDPGKAASIFMKVLAMERIILGELNYGGEALKFIDHMTFRFSEDVKSVIAQRQGASGAGAMQTDISKIQVALSGRKSGEYSNTEQLLAKIWGDILGAKEIDVHDDFFDLGGNSISAIKLESFMERFSMHVSSDDVYKYKTIREMAEFIDGKPMEDSSDNKVSAGKVEGLDRKDSVLTEHQTGDRKADASGGKLLDNIEPFNDIFYKSCFYNSLFPVLDHYGKSNLPFFANDVIIFRQEKGNDDFDLKVEYLQGRDQKEILDEMGMVMEARSFDSHVVADIIRSIQADAPVIIKVDCFYESIREKMYRKMHLPHTLLVYGYNEQDRACHIIEHMHHENLDYGKYTISYTDIENAYRGYMDNYGEGPEESTFFAYYNKDAKAGIKNCAEGRRYSLERFGDTVRNHMIPINQGLEDLEAFITGFKRIILDEGALKSHMHMLMECLNKIINSKLVEMYKIEKLFFTDERKDILLNVLQEVTEKWTYLRKVITKYVYASNYERIDKSKLANASDDIKNLECKYYELLYSFFGI